LVVPSVADHWEIVPFTATNRHFKPKFGEPQVFKLGYSARLLKIIKDIEKAIRQPNKALVAEDEP
jgi:hypothetical protein